MRNDGLFMPLLDDSEHLEPMENNPYLVNYTSYGIETQNINICNCGREQIDVVHRILRDIDTKTFDNVNDLADGAAHEIHNRIETITNNDNAKLPLNRKKVALHRKRTEKLEEINTSERD